MVDIDSHTGLPKLAVELLPEMEVALRDKIDISRKKSVTFDPSTKKMSDEKVKTVHGENWEWNPNHEQLSFTLPKFTHPYQLSKIFN